MVVKTPCLVASRDLSNKEWISSKIGGKSINPTKDAYCLLMYNR